MIEMEYLVLVIEAFAIALAGNAADTYLTGCFNPQAADGEGHDLLR